VSLRRRTGDPGCVTGWQRREVPGEWAYPQPDQQEAGAPCASSQRGMHRAKLVHGLHENASAREHMVASAFSHAFVAIALGKAYSQGPMPWRFWGLSVLCAVLPDADVIGFALGVKYTDMLGHRGLSHSLSFACVLGVSVVWVACSDVVRFSIAWWTLVLYFSLVTASHGVLDAMTNGGLGVAFLAPFDTTRSFLPWRPVQVSPISIAAFLGRNGLRVLRSELVYIWLPTALLCGLVSLCRRPRVNTDSSLPQH
jgi:inner membrane protein